MQICGSEFVHLKLNSHVYNLIKCEYLKANQFIINYKGI